MGSILEGVGTAWAPIWALLGAPGPSWGRSKWNFFKALVQNGLQDAFWKELGWVWGGFGNSFGRGLEPLGASWAVFGTLLFMLVFGVVFKSALGGIWLRFGLIFRGLGSILGEFCRCFGWAWDGFSSILDDSRL